MTTVAIATVAARTVTVATRAFLLVWLPIWVTSFVLAGVLVGGYLAFTDACHEWRDEWQRA